LSIQLDALVNIATAEMNADKRSALVGIPFIAGHEYKILKMANLANGLKCDS